jgi:F-type H+-transporting ATPase subunit gamma
MANLKEVKSRIVSVSSTQQITSAMKMVAAAKLKRAQDRITQMRPYSQKLTSILQNISANLDSSVENVYGQVRESEKVLLVVVSSDRGLCGGFNNNAFKETLKLIKNKYSYEDKLGGITIMPIGKKAYEYFKKRSFKLEDGHWKMFTDLNFDAAKEAAEEVMDLFAEGKYDRVELIYNEFKNVATQILRTEQFLPIESIVTDTENVAKTDADYIYEPSMNHIVHELIPKSLKVQFYKSVL